MFIKAYIIHNNSKDRNFLRFNICEILKKNMIKYIIPAILIVIIAFILLFKWPVVDEKNKKKNKSYIII